MTKRFDAWLALIRLVDVHGRPATVNWHQFRHTLGTRMAYAGLRQRQGGHDPGRIAVDVAMAVMLADGGEAIADLAVLRDQSALFGPVASDPTASRLLVQLDEPILAELRAARAAAREVAWAQHAETRSAPAGSIDQSGPVLNVNRLCGNSEDVTDLHSMMGAGGRSFERMNGQGETQ